MGENAAPLTEAIHSAMDLKVALRRLQRAFERMRPSGWGPFRAGLSTYSLYQSRDYKDSVLEIEHDLGQLREKLEAAGRPAFVASHLKALEEMFQELAGWDDGFYSRSDLAQVRGDRIRWTRNAQRRIDLILQSLRQTRKRSGLDKNT